MFNRYSQPDAVGWLGWISDADGRAMAFVGLDRKVVFTTEIEGWDDTCDPHDPADWWKQGGAPRVCAYWARRRTLATTVVEFPYEGVADVCSFGGDEPDAMIVTAKYYETESGALAGIRALCAQLL